MVEQRKQELVAQLAEARSAIDLGRAGLRGGLSPAMHIKRVMKDSKFKWIVGLLGAFIFLSFFKKKPVKVEHAPPRAGFFRWIFGLLFALAKPSLSKLAIDRVRSEYETRFAGPYPKSRLGAPVQK